MDILRILNTSVLVVALSGALATVVFVSQPLLPFGSGYGRDFEGAEASTLRESVRTLSSLDRAGAEGAAHTADHIVGELARLGIGTGGTWTGATVTRQEFRADGETFANVVVNIPSTVSTSEPKRMII